jgi:hypothetical protein
MQQTFSVATLHAAKAGQECTRRSFACKPDDSPLAAGELRMSRMPPRTLPRTPAGMALLAWKLWRRLPPEARKTVFRAARTQGVRAARNHGPRLASLAVKRALAARRRV